MAFPYYSNLQVYMNMEPIYKSLIEFTIESEYLDNSELDFLNNNIISLEKNVLSFNINEDLTTYNILSRIIRNKTSFNFTIKRYNRQGDIILIIELLNLKFNSFSEDIYDFNYASQDLIKMSVNIVYEKRHTYTNIMKYLRIKKLINIL